MKISVLTFSKETNYGANLQCYALCKTLQGMGHQVDILDIQLKRLSMPWYSAIIGLPMIILFAQFRKKHLNLFTRHFIDIDDLSRNCPQSDLFIVGSDQVWNPTITKRLDPLVYFFSFLPKGTRRMSYAASFGTETWEYPELTDDVYKLLRQFDTISVREEMGVEICKQFFNVDAKLVVDPTLLLPTYDNICGRYDPKREANELTYFTFVHSTTTQKILADFAKSHHLSAVVLRSNRPYPGFKRKLYVSIEEWLNSIRYSKIVVTNSYHCMVFCILFHKKFVAIPAKSERSNRQIHLLNVLGLSRYYCSDTQYLPEILNHALADNIDYNTVDIIIDSLRKQALDYLHTNIRL